MPRVGSQKDVGENFCFNLYVIVGQNWQIIRAYGNRTYDTVFLLYVPQFRRSINLLSGKMVRLMLNYLVAEVVIFLGG